MKKILILLPILFIVTLVFPNNLSFFNRSKAVNKEINLSIFSESDYSSAAYNGAMATIEVTISKMDGAKQVILGNKVYPALPLNQFPDSANAFSHQLSVTGMLSGREALLLTYRITYNSGGSLLTFENKEMISRTTPKDYIRINI